MPPIFTGKINKSEPVQWGIDFLENLIDLTRSSYLTDEYCLKLLAGEYSRLREEFSQLLPLYSRTYNGVLIGEGLPGGRIFVLRLLISVLPPSTPCPLGNEYILRQSLEIKLKQLHNYLKSLKFTTIQRYSMYTLFLRCLNLLESKGIYPGALTKERAPLLIASLPYGEQVPGCYLYPSHVIACYNYNFQELSPAQQVHVILHEIGHLLYFRALRREGILKEYISTLTRLSPFLSAKKN